MLRDNLTNDKSDHELDVARHQLELFIRDRKQAIIHPSTSYGSQPLGPRARCHFGALKPMDFIVLLAKVLAATCLLGSRYQRHAHSEQGKCSANGAIKRPIRAGARVAKAGPVRRFQLGIRPALCVRGLRARPVIRVHEISKADGLALRGVVVCGRLRAKFGVMLWQPRFIETWAF